MSVGVIALLAGAALVASTLAAITGFGGAALLLPIFVAAFGMRDAVPILTIAQLFGNGSRVWFNRPNVDWTIVGWYSLGAIPLALLAGVLFAKAPVPILTRLVGAFLLGAVLWRHVRPGSPPRRQDKRGFVGLGAAASFVSALVGSVGPLMAPFFLAYGLTRGAYIGTEAASTVVTHVVKLVAYGATAVLGLKALYIGAALGPLMVIGSYAGRRVVDRLPEKVFVVIVEVTMVVAGLLFLVRG